MHKKLTKDGFVAMSVDLDDPDDEKLMKNVRDFLKEKQATFQNFVLNEELEVWQQKLGINGAPAVFVFGRDGKVAKKFDEGVNYKDVEKLVTELLKKKE
jgi:peroxiredoxin